QCTAVVDVDVLAASLRGECRACELLQTHFFVELTVDGKLFSNFLKKLIQGDESTAELNHVARPFGNAFIQPKVLGGRRRNKVKLSDYLTVQVQWRDHVKDFVGSNTVDQMGVRFIQRRFFQHVLRTVGMLPGACILIFKLKQEYIPIVWKAIHELVWGDKDVSHGIHRVGRLDEVIL